MFSRQFDAPGSPEDKAALKKQLEESFHDKDLRWIDDPRIKVKRTSVTPGQIDREHMHEWAAFHERDKVDEKRRNIKHGDMKPVAMVNRPHRGPDNLFVLDGHHHEMAYSQLIARDGKTNRNKLHGRMPAYEINVPTATGPWDELHSKQIHNKDD